MSETEVEFWIVLLEAGEVDAVLNAISNEVHKLYDEAWEEAKLPGMAPDHVRSHRQRAERLFELLGSVRDVLRVLHELRRAA